MFSGSRPRMVAGVALAAALALVLATSTAPASAAETPAARTGERFIISGASGQLGELAIQEFLARGVPARNLILVSRSPDKLAQYARLGADVRYGDVDKPESLPAAYRGGTRMVMISLGIAPGAGPRPPRHKIAFDAAARAGVKQVSYTSFLGAGGQNLSGLAADHAESESYLRASGAAWTALRNGFYMDGQLNAALKMASTGKALRPAGAQKAAPVTRADCAAVAVAALLYPGHENKAYEITGPELIDVADVARVVADITGKPVVVEDAPAPAATPGGPPPAGSAAPATVSTAVAELTGRPATSIRAFLESHRAELVAAAASR